ncbi:MAG TPA: hypothetical protein VF920_06860 [Dongiaceae bacterium]
MKKRFIPPEDRLDAYLDELCQLVIGPVDPARVMDLAKAEAYRTLRQAGWRATLTVPFATKNSDQTRDLIHRLHALNAEPALIWTHRSNIHGPYEIASILELNLDFAFDVNREEIISIVSRSGSDKIILDFYESDQGKQELEFDISGLNWPGAITGARRRG